MKKSILIFCAVLTTFSITAIGYMNWSNTVTDGEATSCSKAIVFGDDIVNDINDETDLDLVYNIDSRFMATITKEDLHKATSVLDIVPKVAEGWWKVAFQSVTVAVLHDDGEIYEMGYDKVLNTAQIKLLQSTDYSTNFYIKALGVNNHPVTGKIENYTYYFTIVPEKEAEYTSGQDALIEYLKENSKEETAIIKEDKLQPGKVCFTVTKEGTIANVKLTDTSGYPSIDDALVELVSNMPGKWDPATNAQGEKVDQELVFFFGKQGC